MQIIEIEMPPERGPLAAGVYGCRLIDVRQVTGKYGPQIELTFSVDGERTVRAWISPQSRRRIQECLSAGLAVLGSDGKVRFGGREWVGAIYVDERGRVSGFVPARLAQGLTQSNQREV